MTNPFATFRKNQKVWMAGLVLVAILAFVIGPVFDYAMRAVSGSGAANNPVVVRWNGGQITQAELSSAVQKHSEVVRFLSMLAQKVIEAGGMPRVPNFYADPRSGQILSLGIQYSNQPADICRTRFLEARAKELGVAFDDSAIDTFILEFCDNKLSQEDVMQTMREASGSSLTYYEVCQVLKTELSAYVAARASMGGLFAENRNSLTPISTPGKSFENFAKLNRTSKVEAFPILVDDYVDQVTGEPSDAELQAIYEAGMMSLASSDSSQAGFFRPYKANIEYVEASLDKWTEAEKANVTEEEIKAEYDRRVELGQLQVPVEQEPAEEADEPAGDGGPAEEPPAPAADTTAPSADSTAEPMPIKEETPAETAEGTEDAPATEEPIKEPPKPEEEPPKPEEPQATPTPEASTEPTPAKETPAESTEEGGEPAAEEPPAAPSEPPGGDDQSNVVKRAETRLVALVQEESTPAQEEPADAPETPQEEPATETAEEATETAEATAAPAAEETPASDPPPQTPAQSSESSEAPATDAPGEAEVGSQESMTLGETPAAAESTEPEMRTQTLEEAREMILNSLAREKAIPKLDEALTTFLNDHLRPYYGKYSQYAAELESGQQAGEEPARPDVKKIAEELNLIYHTTGLVDGNALAQTPIGLSNLRQDSGLNGSVANNLMNPGRVSLFTPLQSSYFDQQALMSGEMPEFLQYILWKTEEQDPYIPELSEVRDEVVDAWKRDQARILAEAAATEMSKQVGGGESPWDTALNETQKALLVTTNNFTWMNRMGDYIIPTPVPKLDRVGNEFMQKVFKASPGDVVVSANATRDVYYVARVLDFEPSASDLQLRFNADPIKAGVDRMIMEERNLLRAAWYQQLEVDLGVEWQMSVEGM